MTRPDETQPYGIDFDEEPTLVHPRSVRPLRSWRDIREEAARRTPGPFDNDGFVAWAWREDSRLRRFHTFLACFPRNVRPYVLPLYWHVRRWL